MQPRIQAFFDSCTSTVSYVVYEADGCACALIDPVLDYDPTSGRTSTKSADALIAFVRGKGLAVEWLLETHAHADHLSAAPYLASRLGGKTGIGDATLDMPPLILPAIQVNLNAGQLPAAEENGVRYLKIPINVF